MRSSESLNFLQKYWTCALNVLYITCWLLVEQMRTLIDPGKVQRSSWNEGHKQWKYNLLIIFPWWLYLWHNCTCNMRPTWTENWSKVGSSSIYDYAVWEYSGKSCLLNYSASQGSWSRNIMSGNENLLKPETRSNRQYPKDQTNLWLFKWKKCFQKCRDVTINSWTRPVSVVSYLSRKDQSVNIRSIYRNFCQFVRRRA